MASAVEQGLTVCVVHIGIRFAAVQKVGFEAGGSCTVKRGVSGPNVCSRVAATVLLLTFPVKGG